MVSSSSRGQASPKSKFDTVNEEIADILKSARGLFRSELKRNAKESKDGSMAELAGHLDTTQAKYNTQRFQVAVIALMKAGKSTLINAWLGSSFLPSSSEAQTARIVRIRHNPEIPEGLFKAGQGPAIRGAGEIDCHLRDLNAQARQEGFTVSEDELVLEAPLAALAHRALGQHGFEILDTPGPNESGAEALGAKVERLLHEADVIVYLLDYTRLRSADDHNLFGKLAKTRKELLADYAKRLFFVVNKIDVQNRNGLTAEETADYVADLLRQQVPGLDIKAERVLLVSAEQALLARLVESGRASAEEIADFAKIMFGKRGAQENSTLEKVQPYAADLFRESGMQRLEDVILSHLYENRGQIFLNSLLDDLGRHLDTFFNRVATARGALQADREKMVRQLAQLKQDLASIRGQLQRISETSQSFRADIHKWVKEQFEAFHKEVDTKIDAAFEGKKGLSGLLHDAISKFRSKSTSTKESASKNARDLNEEIARYLRQEFSRFQSEIEKEAYSRQRELFASLKRTTEPLMRRIEEKVGKSLEISLRPVNVEFPMPSLDELHQDLAGSAERFVDRRQSSRTVKDVERKFVEGGWCEDDYWITVPIERTEYYEIHSISVEKIRQFWHQKIAERTRITTAVALGTVGDQIGKAVQLTEVTLQDYADGYIDTIEREISQSSQGEDERKARLQELANVEDQTNKLISRVGLSHEFLARVSR